MMMRNLILLACLTACASGFTLPTSSMARSRPGRIAMSSTSRDASSSNSLSDLREKLLGGLRQKLELGRKEEKILDLLALCDEAQRGATSPEGSDLRAKIFALAEEIEASSTVKAPLESDLINGVWTLRFTTSASILGLSKPKFLRPDPKRPITQMIDAVNLKAKNVEPLKLLGLKYENSVEADLEPLSKSKVKVQFKRFFIGKLFSVKAPERARGELDTTYVDKSLRISRGDRGNLFILTK